MVLLAGAAGLLGSSSAPEARWSERLAVAVALGLTLFLWLPYLAARWWGIEPGAWVALGTLAVLGGAGLLRAARFPRPRERPSVGPLLFLLPLAGCLAYLLYAVDLRALDGGLWSIDAGCEDMGLHATLANAFLRTPELLRHPTYPIFPRWPLGYPFLADFSAAVGMALGAPIGVAFSTTALFAAAALLANLHALARRWLSSGFTVLAVALFLLGGNLGVVYFLRDLPSADLSRIWFEDYTNRFTLGLHYGNMVTAVLLPMRTSLFGAPIALAALSLVSRAEPPARRESVVAGLLLGALPLVNAHAFLAVGLCAAVYGLRHPRTALERWWPAMLVAAALALPQVRWVHEQMAGSATPFLRRSTGFLFDTTLDWPRYWLLNGGLFAPLAVAAWARAGRDLRRATLPLLLLLPLAMAVSFQPNPFDNIKLLLFVHVGCALLVADLARRWMARGRAGTLLATAAIVVCTASGVLSWVRAPGARCVMATADDRAFAARVLEATDEHSVVLTAQQLNHPVPFLTGRTILLGFHNWLSQHGIPFQRRADDVREIYAGTVRAPELLTRYGVTDVVVGPAERAEFGALDEAFLAGRAAARTTQGAYTLYHLAP